jgi:uncharacterized damage-inducible protein DinB
VPTPPDAPNDVAAVVYEEAIEFLGFAREGTIGEARNIPDDRWDYRPHPKARSVAELVRHIIELTAMLVGEAADPHGDFQRRSDEEHVRAHVGDLPERMSPAELRAALERTRDTDIRRIRAAGVDHMANPIRRFDGGTWLRVTYVFYAASHEDYHRGQLASYARTMGLVPALTQQIYGAGAG